MQINARVIASLGALVLGNACAGGGAQPSAMLPSSPAARTTASATANAKSVPAYFNGQLFSVFITPLSPTAAAQIIAKNKNLNKIFEAPTDPAFIPVIDDIQGRGFHFNPLWQVVDITFTGIGATQFTSADQINSAAMNHQISLTLTNQVDSVPVVGPKS